MGKNSNISWTDHSWNPWQGCEKVSEGCVNCYMFTQKKRFGLDGGQIHRSKESTFAKPIHWKEPAKVFTCSWSDFFIREADPWRGEAWEIIRRTPHLTYQILTKRPERIADCLPDFWAELNNVWLGVTVEKQRHLDRISHAAAAAPPVLFVSIEPMLGPIDLSVVIESGMIWDEMRSACYMIDWIICGGESGVGCRPMDLLWARSLKAQCEEFDIPFFFKQVSGVTKKQCALIPDDLRIQQFPLEEK